MNINKTIELARIDINNGHLVSAKSLIQKALIYDQNNAQANHFMGVIQSSLKNYKDSLLYLERAVKLEPRLTEAKFNLGKAYRNLKDYKNAVKVFAEITEANPSDAKTWLELAMAQEKLGDLDNTIQSLGKAVDAKLETYNLLCKMGSLHMDKSDYHSAKGYFLKAIKMNAKKELAWINLAISYENLCMPHKSIEIYKKLCAKDTPAPQAELRLALTLLSQGKMKEGWKYYQNRSNWKETNTSHGQLDTKFWDGQDLTNKSILIWTEQGPGDEILTGSMIPEIIARQTSVSIACSPKIAPLFQRTFPKCNIIQKKENSLPLDIIGKPDYQASITELGENTRNHLTKFTASRPYLTLNTNCVELLKKRYNSGQSDIPIIGISWKSANKKTSKNKSTELNQWYPILSQKNAHFVCLQYGNTEKERKIFTEQCNQEIIYDPDINQLENIDLFAHQVAAMDLIISTSNTTVHVAGGVGTTTWAIIPEGTGKPWYWFLDRKDCLWYPSVSFYRQKKSGDWHHPLTEINKTLSQWIKHWTSQKH